MIEYIKFLNNQIEQPPYSGKFKISVACTTNNYRLKDFSVKKVRSLADSLRYIQSQRLATVKITSNLIVLEL